MRIVVISNDYPNPEHPHRYAFVHIRARAYRRLGYDVVVLTEGRGASYEFEGVPVHSLPFDLARKWLRDSQADVLAVHSPYGFSLELASAVQTRCVAWIHGHEALYASFYGYRHGVLRNALGVFKDAIKLARLRGFVQRCAAVVYVSNWMRGRAEFGMQFRHPSSHVIPNPVDPDQFDLKAASPVGPPRGLAVRSLSNRKYGLDVAIRSYAGIDGTHLTIVGVGRLEGPYRKLISDIGASVTIRAESIPHHQMRDLYHSYDYFVAPSRTEAQGVGMCEAMCCGLPVVATSVGGIPEFVRDGVDGFLVPPDDPRALRRAVEDLVSDVSRLKAMGLAARENILRLCATDTVIARELSLLGAE